MESTNLFTSQDTALPECVEEIIPQNEVDYALAQQLTDMLYVLGYLSNAEYEMATELNRQKFSPFLAEIIPKVTCF